MKQVIREGLNAAAQRVQATGLLIGWEVRGGFATDIEFKNLSLHGLN